MNGVLDGLDGGRPPVKLTRFGHNVCNPAMLDFAVCMYPRMALEGDPALFTLMHGVPRTL
jgi:hypothetical protein